MKKIVDKEIIDNGYKHFTSNPVFSYKPNELYSSGNQAKFSEFSHIKESTLKTWRSRGAIPDDKKLLLTVLIEKHELIQENSKFQEYFKLQNEFVKKFQN